MTLNEYLEITWQLVGALVSVYLFAFCFAKGWKDGKGRQKGTVNIHQIVFKEDKDNESK